MIKRCINLMKESQSIVILSGAGVSTASGIPDYRSKGGLYSNLTTPEKILSPDTLYNNPEQFYKFVLDHMYFPEAKPNWVHKTISKLQMIEKVKTVITQNVDKLHSIVPHTSVLEYHGNIYDCFCTICNEPYTIADVKSHGYYCLQCKGLIRPKVVLYEEAIDPILSQQALDVITESDLVLVIGTSLQVYPFAGLVRYRGGKLIIINLTPTPSDLMADVVIHEDLIVVFEQIHNAFFGKL